MRLTAFFASLAFVIVGVVLFMFNLGYGSWVFLEQLTRLWPVTLILLGFSLFWGGRIPRWLALVVTVAMAGGVAAYLYHAPPSAAPDMKGRRELVVERSRYPVNTGRLVMGFGAGKLTVGSDAGEWLEGEFAGRGAAAEVARVDDRLEVELRQPRIPAWLLGGMPHSWDVQLSPELDWGLVLNIGATDADLDLSKLKLHSFDLKLGAADLNLKLGDRSPRLDVQIDGGASDVHILVPRAAGISVRFAGALSDSNLDRLGWPRVGGRFLSPGYAGAAAHIDLDIDLGVGDLDLELYGPEGGSALDRNPGVGQEL